MDTLIFKIELALDGSLVLRRQFDKAFLAEHIDIGIDPVKECALPCRFQADGTDFLIQARRADLRVGQNPLKIL